MSELDDNTNKSELYENNDYYNYMSTEDNQNFKELNAEIDFDKGTISTVGVDDHDLPYLLKTDQSELIQEFKTKVDNKEKIEPSFLTKMGGIVEGFKSWTMSAPSGDYKIALDKASLQIGDAITQFNRLITGGKIDNIFDDQPRIFRLSQEGSADIVIRATNSEVEEKFYNMQMEFRENGKYHPFETDGNLKEGWQEISQFVAASDDIEYTNKGFTPAPFVEYGLAYGVPGVGLYKALANANSFRKIPLFFQVLLAETGVEFAMASQKKDDVNLGNVFKAFGFGDIDENVPSSIGGKTSLMTKYINVFRESVAADLDDTVFERKWKNASGNAPIGVGLGAILQMFRMAKKFKYNKSGRAEIATNIDQEIIVDKGLDGEYKVYDTNGVEIGGFKSQAEAEEFAETLGEGFEAKSLGAAATPTTKEDLSSMGYVDSDGFVKINIPEEDLAKSDFDRIEYVEGSERPFRIYIKGSDTHTMSFRTQQMAEENINANIKQKKIIEEENALIRSKSEKPFYSNVENAISNMTMKSGNGDQILATLNNTSGIKQSEIEDLGLNEFLAGKKKVTKEELDDFIADKSLTTRVKETFLEGSPGERVNDIDFADGVREEFKNSYDFDDAMGLVENDENIYRSLLDYVASKDIPIDDIDDQLIENFLKDEYGMTRSDSPRPTRFDNQTLPGGKDYKEILITAPGTPQVYTKHHFKGDVPDGENLIAHARFNTREINGKKTLFIEEIQSDLHQDGRKHGYTSVEKKKIQNEIEQRKENLKITHGDNYSEEIYYDDTQINTLMQKRDNVFMLPDLVADAPFKKNWHELTMKRLIKYAVDNDFEAISFTPGSVQNKRYDLSAQVDSIRAEKIIGGFNDGQYELNIKTHGRGTADRVIPENKLEEFVGKDLANKIINDAPTYKDGREYSGLDLEFGGQGMEGFYDNMLPTFLKKFGKKYNAKLEKTFIGEDGTSINFVEGKYNYENTRLREAKTIEDVYRITKENKYLQDEFQLYLRDDINEPTYANMKFNELQKELGDDIESYINEWLMNDYGLFFGEDTLNKVPFMVITPEMKKDILTKGVPIAKVEDREEKTSAVA